MSDAIKHQLPPKVTRSQERKEEWAPSAKSLSTCKNAKEFKRSFVEPDGGGCLAAELWKHPQCCFVNYAVLKAFGEDCTEEAGDLATDVLRACRKKQSNDPKGEDEAKDPEKEFNVLLFLWAIKHSWIRKAPLYKAPNNKNFDRLAQKVWKKLEKKKKPSFSKDQTRCPQPVEAPPNPVKKAPPKQTTGPSQENRPLAHLTGQPSKILATKEKREEGKGVWEKGRGEKALAPPLAIQDRAPLKRGNHSRGTHARF
jgi:hypothetical protein